MKFLRLLLLFSFVAHFAGAQSFSDTSSVWNYHWQIMTGPWETNTFQIGGDTMINSVQYNKVLKGYNNFPPYNFPYAVREDILSKRVYFYNYVNAFEFLAYDFSLAAGDTFYFNAGFCSQSFVVQSVDSILLLDGQYRKRMHLDGGYQETWIEGIGSMYWLIPNEYHCSWDTYFELLCFTEHDTLKYMEPFYQTCFHNTISVSEESLNKVPDISPNIFSDFTILNSHGNSGLRLTIFDLTGKQVREYSEIGADKFVIDRGNLASGVYTFRIDSDDQFIQAGKLIVY